MGTQGIKLAIQSVRDWSLTLLYNSYILTDMRKLLIELDDELSPLLAKEKNQNETVRKALRLYYSDIDTSDIQSIKASFIAIKNYLKETDAKIDYIAEKIQ